MYNAHRGIVQPPTNNNNRLSELFDQIRREFDVHAQDRAGEHDQNSTFAQFPFFPILCSKACPLPLLGPRDEDHTIQIFSNPSVIYATIISITTSKLGNGTETQSYHRKLTTAENAVAAQMQEMELVRQKVYELERNQIQIKQRFAPVSLNSSCGKSSTYVPGMRRTLRGCVTRSKPVEVHPRM